MPGPWSEDPGVPGVPSSSGGGIIPGVSIPAGNYNLNLNIQQALNNYFRSQAEQQKNAGPAGTGPRIGGGAPAMMSTGGGGLISPMLGGITSQQVAARLGGAGGGGGGMTAAGGGVPGAGPTAITQLSRAQVQPAEQMGYYTGGARGGAVVNAAIGVSNLLGRIRETNQRQEAREAESTWSQLMAAQDTLNKAAEQGIQPTDPSVAAAYNVIQDFSKDKKKQKQVEDALGYIAPQIPGGDGQQQQAPPKQTPASQGAMRAIESRAKRLAQRVGGAFDPRTPAQRMPAGAQQGAGVNQPGGISWQLPQPTAAAMAQRAALESLSPNDWIRKTRIEMKLDPSADAAAMLQAREDQMKATEAYRDIIIHGREQDRQFARDRFASGFGEVMDIKNPAVAPWAQRWQNGDITDISKVPQTVKYKAPDGSLHTVDVRQSVATGLMDQPIRHKLNAKQLDVKRDMETGIGAEKLVERDIANLEAKYPGISTTDAGIPGGFHKLSQIEAWYRYRFGLVNNDPDYQNLLENSAWLRLAGGAAFATYMRSRYTWSDVIQPHLVNPDNDTVANIATKARWWRDVPFTQQSVNIQRAEWGGAPPPIEPFASPNSPESPLLEDMVPDDQSDNPFWNYGNGGGQTTEANPFATYGTGPN